MNNVDPQAYLADILSQNRQPSSSCLGLTSKSTPDSKLPENYGSISAMNRLPASDESPRPRCSLVSKCSTTVQVRDPFGGSDEVHAPVAGEGLRDGRDLPEPGFVP